jgi:2-keto-4-pentenoate hydratase/2-oxohepta-3-ene-1,7-dioic acid hydratase in catechol pathway
MWPGKSFDTHGPIGAWVVTADEVDPAGLGIRTWVDGELRLDGSTKEMVTGIGDRIAALSSVCKPEPGGLIATGTCPANSPVPTRQCLPCGRPWRQAPCRN